MLALLALAGCGKQPQTAAAQPDKTDVVAGYQRELLELAATAVDKFPLNPHIKARSLGQERVVTACLKLDQPDLALACSQKIKNFRRGCGLADYVHHQVLRGRSSDAHRDLLTKAIDVARASAKGVNSQKWRVDRVRAKVARAYLALDDVAAAKTVAGSLSDSEIGIVLAAQATYAKAGKTLEDQLATLDQLLKAGNFDQLKGVMDACLALYEKFYADAKRRAALEKRVKTAFAKLPVEVRIRRSLALARISVRQGDLPSAQALVQESSSYFAQFKWLPEHRIALRSELAAVWHQAGRPEVAAREVKLAREDYARDGKKIVDMFRGGALRPLAEALQAMGDTAGALQTYKLAIEEGVHNVNSRPRAHDLAQTCCSMAIHGVEPDAELWARIRQIRDQLGDPW